MFALEWIYNLNEEIETIIQKMRMINPIRLHCTQGAIYGNTRNNPPKSLRLSIRPAVVGSVTLDDSQWQAEPSLPCNCVFHWRKDRSDALVSQMGRYCSRKDVHVGKGQE